MGKLEDIFQPIQQDLEKFSTVFEGLLKSRVRAINLIARYLVKQRGKRVRPSLVILAAHLCGGPREETYKYAALIEMLHNATLIHDDVVDDANVRRGRPSIKAVWKNKVSILMGDYILARSLITAAETKDISVIEVLSEASSRMSQGEIDQMMKSRGLDFGEEQYFRIISDKTASLFSASCELGAISAGTTAENRSKMKDFGEKLGLAFQIKDDLLDFQGEEKLFGKKKGTDIRDGKITLPFIYALNKISGKEQKKILKHVKKNATSEDIQNVISFINEHGGMTYAEKKAKSISDEAKAILDKFDNSAYRNSATSLLDFILNRKK